MKEFTIEGNVLVAYNGNDAIVTVPQGVTKIGKGCFQDKSFIKEIRLPETGLQKVEPYAFAGTGMTSITFYGGSERIEIEAFAFRGCTLERITGNNLWFGKDALSGCTVSHIYIEDGYFWDGLENCVIHSLGGRYNLISTYFIWDFCAANARNGVRWEYLYDMKELQETTRKAYERMRAKGKELETFRKKANLGVRTVFCKNSAKTRELQEILKRLEAESREAYEAWRVTFDDLNSKSKSAKEQEAAYREYLQHGNLASVSVNAAAVARRLQEQSNSPSKDDGAFVPVPDITGI